MLIFLVQQLFKHFLHLGSLRVLALSFSLCISPGGSSILFWEGLEKETGFQHVTSKQRWNKGIRAAAKLKNIWYEIQEEGGENVGERNLS